MDRSVLNSYLDLFDKSCETKPDAVAVKAGNRSLTYSRLCRRVNQLANFLAKNGATSEALIGVSAARSPEMIVSMLAIHRIGAAYVPLDLAYPPDRLKYMMEDSGLRLILSDQASRFVTYDRNIEIIDVTRIASSLATEKAAYPRGAVRPERLAYVIYTSGSTGHPKGVMVTHANLLNFVNLVPQALPIRDDDVYLQSASITYAVSVRQIFTALSHGLKLVIAGSSAIQDPVELFRLIKDEKVTLVDFVPSHWRSCNVVLKSLPEPERVELLRNNLRRIVTIGEPLLPDLPLEWRDELHHPAQLVNVFGQTETTGLITSFDISKAPLDGSKVVSIGRPIPDTRVYILDPVSLDQLESGDVGELCVSNACVAKGYLNNSDLTSTKFVPNPFPGAGGHLLYRTGDFARFAPDGTLEYLGRSDQQVKIRGMRVELGEIEAVILRNPAVKEAVVIPQTRTDHGKVLVAFLAPWEKQKIRWEELRKFVKANVPAHMVPVHYVELRELPRNLNGKINRKELMEYRVQTGEGEHRVRPSLTAHEEELCSIWKRLLKIDSLQITDDFFDDLGGDSLLAVLMFLEIERTFGRRLPISSLYRAPTIEKITRLLEGADHDRGFHSLVPIKPTGTEPPLFIVHGAGGNVLIYRDLSKQLAKNMPIFGLQSYGLDGASDPLDTVEEMARAYVREVKLVQPSGPYFLCGYCMGGTIAFEMAQQLKNGGDDVRFLAMLETYNWSQLPPRSLYDKTKFLAEKGVFHWMNFWLLTSAGRTSFFTNKFKELKNRSRIWAGRVLFLLKKKEASSSNILVKQSEIWKRNDRACFEYRADYYDGRMTVFLPKKKYSVHSVPEAIWTHNQAKAVDLVTLPFYPAGMLVEPFVQELARNITAKITKAGSGHTPSSS